MRYSIAICCFFLWAFVTRSHAQPKAPPEPLATTPVKPDTNTIKALIDAAEKIEGTEREKAMQQYLHAAALAQRIDYHFGIAKASNYAGILYADAGRYSEAAGLYKQAIFHYTKAAYKRGLASATLNLGNVYKFQGSNREALHYYLSAAALLEEASDSDRLTIVYNNMGALFATLKNSAKAIEYSGKALAIAEKKGLERNIVNACINLDKAYALAKDTASAVNILMRGFPIAEKLQDFKALTFLHNNLAVYHMHQHKMRAAAHHYNQALAYSNRHGDPLDISHTCFSLAVFYKWTKDWKQAEVFAAKALKLSDSVQAHDLTAKIYNVLSDVEEQRGNYKKAYEYYIDFVAYNDSVSSREQLQLMHDLEAKYQSTRKDKALAEKSLALERSQASVRQKNTWLLLTAAGLLVVLLVGLLIYFFYRNRRRLAQQQLQALERERELRILQAMIEGEERERGRIAGELHDGIGGMVSAIKMHLGVSKLEHSDVGGSDGYRQAFNLLEALAKEVRKTAHTLMPELLHKYGLEEAIRMHCHAMSNKTLDVHFQSYNVTPAWSAGATLLLYRTVQELLNNAVKHAAASQVLVELAQDEKTVTITVEDNGNGFTEAERAAGDGMGLSTIEAKIAALEGKLEIESKPATGTTVTIEIPNQNLALV